MHYTGHFSHVSFWCQGPQCREFHADDLLQETFTEQSEQRKVGCGQNVQRQLREGNASSDRVSLNTKGRILQPPPPASINKNN